MLANAFEERYLARGSWDSRQESREARPFMRLRIRGRAT
jgi:hypothetical protein